MKVKNQRNSMSNLTEMIEHLALSVDPMMKLVSGFCYCVGINLVWVSTKKFNKIADWRARGGTGGPTFIPFAYLLGGLVFLFLPSTIDIATNTFFGNSILGYSDYLDELQAKYGNYVYATMRLINLAGLIWCVRGISLMVHASEPGIQHGPKGMWFLIAGIFALNLEQSEMVVTYVIEFISTSSNTG